MWPAGVFNNAVGEASIGGYLGNLGGDLIFDEFPEIGTGFFGRKKL